MGGCSKCLCLFPRSWYSMHCQCFIFVKIVLYTNSCFITTQKKVYTEFRAFRTRRAIIRILYLVYFIQSCPSHLTNSFLDMKRNASKEIYRQTYKRSKCRPKASPKCHWARAAKSPKPYRRAWPVRQVWPVRRVSNVPLDEPYTHQLLPRNETTEHAPQTKQRERKREREFREYLSICRIESIYGQIYGPFSTLVRQHNLNETHKNEPTLN